MRVLKACLSVFRAAVLKKPWSYSAPAPCEKFDKPFAELAN